ncbi:MAG: hypothetical protein J6Q39_04165 [Bacteroidales bacterium]|nr:hypothetical protein [Bacteroidales bacterium]
MKAKIETGLFKIEVETDTMLEAAVFEKVEKLLSVLAENSVVVVKDMEALK